jgi:hypothetical protein
MATQIPLPSEEFVRQVQEMLARKQVRLDCPRCNQLGWDVMGYSRVVISQDPQGADYAFGRRAIALRCQHCGFYSLHDDEILDA